MPDGWPTSCTSGENVPSKFLGNVTCVTSSSHIWHFAIYRYKCDASHCTLQLLPCWTWFQDIITNESWSSFYCHLVPDYPPYPHPLHKPLSLPSPPRVTIRCLVRATSLGNQWLWRPSSLAERLRGRSKKWVGPVYWWHEDNYCSFNYWQLVVQENSIIMRKNQVVHEIQVSKNH